MILTSIVALAPFAGPRVNEVSLNLRGLMYAVGVLFAELWLRVLCALRMSRLRPTVAMREKVRSVAGGAGPTRRWLVMSETSFDSGIADRIGACFRAASLLCFMQSQVSSRVECGLLASVCPILLTGEIKRSSPSTSRCAGCHPLRSVGFGGLALPLSARLR